MTTALTPEQVKDSIDELGRTWKSFREENDKLLAEGKQTQVQWTEKLHKLNERMDELDTKLNRRPAPQLSPKDTQDEQARRQKAAFLNFCRYGLEGMSAEEKSLLAKDSLPGEKKSLSSPQGVEYLASPEVTNEIIKGVVEFSPIRTVARVRTTGAKSVKIRKRTGTFAAAWIGKTATRTETTGLKYGLEEVPTHELYALVDIPFEDLEDSDFNLEAELNLEASEQFGVAEGLSSVSGDAVGEWEGLLTNAAMGFTVSGDANLITGDGLIQLYVDVKDAYARNGTWMLKRDSIGKVRKLKDSQGQYVWMPGLSSALPSTILDRPYVEAVDMPTIAASAFPVLFGDFRRGYTVIDRVQIAVIRDQFTQANNGAVRFHFRKRSGGQVVNVEAIRKLKIST
ncbi:MAG: phage major capsid protein [Nitrospira sp.]|nr:phage major capsid protein [Nitrospira sp.]